MVYANRQQETTERNYYANGADISDRTHWGAIIAGLVIALSTQLLLSALGGALGFTTIANSGAPRTDAGGVGTAVGIWAIVSLFISLFIGGWITARACGSVNRNTAALNGAILWATTLALSAWLLASGVSGTFGIALANAGNIAGQAQQNGLSLPNLPNTTNSPNTNSTPLPTPSISAQDTRDIASNGGKAAWGFTLGSLLGLASAIMGATMGARNTRAYSTNHIDDQGR